MSMVSARLKTLTAEDLVEMPDDGIERDIIRGELREYRTDSPMTRRNPDHTGIEATIARLLGNWLETQPTPRGRIHSGEAGFRLRREPETYVGIDVAYVSAAMAAGRDRKQRFYDGPPILAVEILSPSDKHEKIVEKVELYLEVGTIVWVVDPDFRTVRVHRPGQPVALFNDQQDLLGDPELPGFRVAVARLFEG
jgi:Uma2 family endonuclease